MRAAMGVIKDRHGTYYAQQKVPERLQQAVAVVLGNGKTRRAYLKKSLGTKDLKTANRVVKLVQIEFDRVLQEAESLVHNADKPLVPRTTLTDAEITRIAEYIFAKGLALDERMRFGGREEWQLLDDQARREAQAEGRELAGSPAYALEDLPTYGTPTGWLEHERSSTAEDLSTMQDALARGDISPIADEVEIALAEMGFSLDSATAAYRKLGTAVLQRYVEMLQALEDRNAGKPVVTPKAALAVASPAPTGGTLKEALEGWDKERARPEGTVSEYTRAVEMFIQLHGNLPIADIKRSHAREFREAVQMVPRHRQGTLLKASLPELVEWARRHPEAPKVSPGSVNKQLGAVQAIARWGAFNGLVPEDDPWRDPFEKMRVEEDESEREPLATKELQQLFDTALFTAHEIPEGARGEAGVWLPLLALYTGCRQAELAGLRVADVTPDATPLLSIASKRTAGRRLKTKVSARVIPIHPQLVMLGFLDYVAARRREAGDDAWLFPLVAPGQAGGVKAWSKWFGRFLRTKAKVHDVNKVFHSLRHAFKDALRVTTSDEELRDSLLGQSSGKRTVGRTYGAKQMLERWGVERLNEAVSKVTYRGLDLSRVQPLAKTITRGDK
jgi:integrase